MTNKDTGFSTIANHFHVQLDADDATARLFTREFDPNTESYELELVTTFTGAFDERAVRAKLRTLFCAEIADLIEVRAE